MLLFGDSRELFPLAFDKPCDDFRHQVTIDIGKGKSQILVLFGAEDAARQAHKIVIAGQPLGDRFGSFADEWMAHISKECADAHEVIGKVGIRKCGPERLGAFPHHLQFFSLPIDARLMGGKTALSDHADSSAR